MMPGILREKRYLANLAKLQLTDLAVWLALAGFVVLALGVWLEGL